MKGNVDGTHVEPVMLKPRKFESMSSSRSRFRPLRSSSGASGIGSAFDVSRALVPCGNCPDMAVSPVFALDHAVSGDASIGTVAGPLYGPSTTSDHILEIYVVDADRGDVWSLDSTGCRCRLVVNASELAARVSSSGGSKSLCKRMLSRVSYMNICL